METAETKPRELSMMLTDNSRLLSRAPFYEQSTRDHQTYAKYVATSEEKTYQSLVRKVPQPVIPTIFQSNVFILLMKLGREFHTTQIQGFFQLMPGLWAGIGELHRQDKTSLAALHRETLVLIGRSLWTSKGRHPSCSAIIGKVIQKDSQNCWPRRSLETICHTALKLYRKSDKAEFYFPVCSLHLPSLLTWGEHQEYLVKEILYMVQYSTPVIATFALHFLFFPWE